MRIFFFSGKKHGKQITIGSQPYRENVDFFLVSQDFLFEDLFWRGANQILYDDIAKIYMMTQPKLGRKTRDLSHCRSFWVAKDGANVEKDQIFQRSAENLTQIANT